MKEHPCNLMCVFGCLICMMCVLGYGIRGSCSVSSACLCASVVKLSSVSVSTSSITDRRDRDESAVEEL